MSWKGYNAQHEGTVRNYASLAGLNPELALNVMRMESRGHADIKPIGKNGKPLSSAVGLFQMLDNTWEGEGGRPEERNNPEAQARLGVQYLAKGRDYLKKNLGRDVQDHEVYLGHLLGHGGARELLSANPDAPLRDVVSKFSKNPDAVIKNNAMTNDMTVGQAIGMWRDKYNKASMRPARIPEAGAVKPNPIPQKPAVQPMIESPQAIVELPQVATVEAPVQQQSAYRGLANELVAQRDKAQSDYDTTKALIKNKAAKEPVRQREFDMSGLANALAQKSYGFNTSIGKKAGGSRLNFTN